MLSDAAGLVKILKKTAVEAMDATKPVNVCFGTVESVMPLQINVEQKMILGSAQLTLSRNVTDFSVDVTADWQTESHAQTTGQECQGETEPGGNPEHAHKFKMQGGGGGSHDHKISGKKKIILHNALAVGEIVILLRQQGGQKYIVLDRIGGE